jgi:hypothetical protein
MRAQEEQALMVWRKKKHGCVHQENELYSGGKKGKKTGHFTNWAAAAAAGGQVSSIAGNSGRDAFDDQRSHYSGRSGSTTLTRW